MIHSRKTRKWSKISTFKIPVVMLESTKEFVFIWCIKVALFLDILAGLVTTVIYEIMLE